MTFEPTILIADPPEWLDVLDGNCATPAGFRTSGIACGIKADRLDLALLATDQPATAAGMFTTNRVQAAPVRYCREVIGGGLARLVVINSGNANACTGAPGLADTHETARLAAEAFGVAPDAVLVCSTGVIGRRLPMDKLRAGIPRAVKALSRDGAGAAEAILTTDTGKKTAAARIHLAGGEVTIGGMAKGSGMIAPDLELPAISHATALAFLSTDARIDAARLAEALRLAVDHSLNCVTVDGDTSTNDTILALASGASGLDVADNQDYRRFVTGLTWVARRLALAIARDGEGAQRVIAVRVRGARDTAQARRVARTVAESPLVKTAFCAGEPNWGRFLMAVGRAGAEVIEDRIGVRVGDLEVVNRGLGTDLDPERLRAEMTRAEVILAIDLGIAEGAAEVWTCDLTEEYVRINGLYLT